MLKLTMTRIGKREEEVRYEWRGREGLADMEGEIRSIL